MQSFELNLTNSNYLNHIHSSLPFDVEDDEEDHDSDAAHSPVFIQFWFKARFTL